MITFSIIQKSQLEGTMRLDAEYYQPEYFIDFTKGDWRPIGNFLKKCQYGLSQAMNDEKKGYPIFKMDNINHAFLFDDEVRYADISKGVFNDFRLEKNDVLFNRVNSEEFVGRTGIFKLDLKSVFASYLIRLQINENSVIKSDYLNIFLNSKYGLKQIRKFSRRAVNQANVNAEELKQIKIPILSLDVQKEIGRLSDESWRNFKLSKELYQQAENLLLEELELKDFKSENDLSYIVNLSEVRSVDRVDAEYFQTIYGKLKSKIEKYGARKLGDVIENAPARFKPKPDEDYRYVELANINSSIGVIDGFSGVLGKEAPSRAKRLLNSGDVIVSSIEGSLEKVALVDEEQNDYLASTGFFQFRSKEILPEVLLVLARSLVFQMQLQKETAGTILTAVSKEAVKNVLVPILPKSIQQKIADLVQKSHTARSKAKQLLEQAKNEVEKLIENKSL